MDQKQKTLIILKVLFRDIADENDRQYIIEKIDACFELVNPEVLLDQEGQGIYQEMIDNLRKRGKIV